MVGEIEKLYPADVDRSQCVLQRTQYAWRIGKNGKAVYVRYEIYNLPGSEQCALPPGLRNSRSEYGFEIGLLVAYLHYWIGVSLDHACAIIQFFTDLELSKSQANSLLNQLSEDWSEQEEAIAELIALQLIVYIDETGWKVGMKSCYTWVFTTSFYVLYRCGVSREKEEAIKILGETFNGIGVSDDYGAYKNLFATHQLCWAHLIRKAVKLMLQNPDQTAYAEFLRSLSDIYRQAIAYQKDRRLSVGRGQKVVELKASIKALCTDAGEPISDTTTEHQATFIRLQNELVNNLDKLFVFVEHTEVEPTNNISERNVRREAEIRKGGRTSKTQNGAKRRGVIVSVLMSLRKRFERFTMKHLLDEIQSWFDAGRSVFQQGAGGYQNGECSARRSLSSIENSNQRLPSFVKRASSVCRYENRHLL